MRFTTRRRFCRVLFCTLCLLPTLLVGGAAVVVHTSAYQAAKTTHWRTLLAARLGLEVEVGQIDWSDTAELVVRNIELRDPESHVCLAHARSATIVHGDTGPIIRLGQPEVDFAHLPRLVEILHEHLLLRSVTTGASFQLAAPTLLLKMESRSESMLDLRFVLEVKDHGTEAFIEFQPASLESRDRERIGSSDDRSKEKKLLRLRLVRNRQLDPPATGWELHTGDADVPCSLVQPWLPQVEYFGTDCTFRGSIWSEQSVRGWEAEVAGVFRQLDLDSLVTRHFPHRLSGIAELALRRMVVHHGRMVEARGRLLSEGGVVSQTLIHAAEEHLALKRYSPESEAMLLSYDLLSLEFSLDKNGLVVAGAGDQGLAILADSKGPLLSSQDTVKVPARSLVHLLVPLTDLQVPAAEETVALLQMLPLPPVNPTATANARRSFPSLELLRE